MGKTYDEKWLELERYPVGSPIIKDGDRWYNIDDFAAMIIGRDTKGRITEEFAEALKKEVPDRYNEILEKSLQEKEAELTKAETIEEFKKVRVPRAVEGEYADLFEANVKSIEERLELKEQESRALLKDLGRQRGYMEEGLINEITYDVDFLRNAGLEGAQLERFRTVTKSEIAARLKELR